MRRPRCVRVALELQLYIVSAGRRVLGSPLGATTLWLGYTHRDHAVVANTCEGQATHPLAA